MLKKSIKFQYQDHWKADKISKFFEEGNFEFPKIGPSSGENATVSPLAGEIFENSKCFEIL